MYFTPLSISFLNPRKPFRFIVGCPQIGDLKEPILPGAIFEQGTDEVQTAFKFAMLNHNQNVTGRKFELQAFVDVINTADAFKLSRLSRSQIRI